MQLRLAQVNSKIIRKYSNFVDKSIKYVCILLTPTKTSGIQSENTVDCVLMFESPRNRHNWIDNARSLQQNSGWYNSREFITRSSEESLSMSIASPYYTYCSPSLCAVIIFLVLWLDLVVFGATQIIFTMCKLRS